MARRAKGEGSIYRLKNGRYRGYITIGYKPNGEAIRKYRNGKTKKEVAEKLKKIAHLASNRIIQSPTSYTVEDWLNHFSEIIGHGKKPSTRVSQRYYFAKAITYFGQKRLDTVTRHHIQKFYKALFDQGLGIETRSHVHHLLKAAFNEADYHGLVYRNPVIGVKVPPGRRETKSKTWEPHQVWLFLETAREAGDRFYPFFFIMITQGLRPGEALALKWDDIDFKRQTLRIDETLSRNDEKLKNRLSFGTPKSHRSERVIALREDAIKILLEQKQKLLVDRCEAKTWTEMDLVFPSSVGTPMAPNNLIRRHFKPLIKKAGLPLIRLYGLRHIHITLKRDLGVDMEVVAHQAGQDPKITASIYSRVTLARQRKAAKTLEELVNPHPTEHPNGEKEEEK